MDDLHHNVRRVFQQIIEGSSEIATSQTKQWEQSQELATQLQLSLGSMKDGDMQAVLGAFDHIHSQLVSLTAFLGPESPAENPSNRQMNLCR